MFPVNKWILMLIGAARRSATLVMSAGRQSKTTQQPVAAPDGISPAPFWSRRPLLGCRFLPKRQPAKASAQLAGVANRSAMSLRRRSTAARERSGPPIDRRPPWYPTFRSLRRHRSCRQGGRDSQAYSDCGNRRARRRDKGRGVALAKLNQLPLVGLIGFGSDLPRMRSMAQRNSSFEFGTAAGSGWITATARPIGGRRPTASLSSRQPSPIYNGLLAEAMRARRVPPIPSLTCA